MSIIYEALKKVEQNGNPDSSCREPKEISSSVRPKNKTVLLSGRSFRVLLFTILAAGLISVVSLNWQFIHGKVFSLSLLARKEYFPNSQDRRVFKTPQPQKAAFPQSKPEGYLLGGIIYSDDSPVAIINGNTLREEDLISDFKVSEITSNSVTLINTKDSTELKLSF